MGGGNDVSGRRRRKTFRSWVLWAQPDILFVEELSATLLPGHAGVAAGHDGIATGASIAGISGMTYLNHVETLQEGAHPASTKNIVALRRPGLVGGGAIGSRAVRMHSSNILETARMKAASRRAARSGVRGRTARGLHVQPRMCLKLTNVPVIGERIEVIGVHAKSGGAGRGRQAVAWALEYVRGARKTVIGGDFNFHFGDIVFPTDRAGRRPALHGGANASFTQWAKNLDYYHPAHAVAGLGLPAFQRPNFQVLAHDILDYVIYNTHMMVNPINSVPPPALGLAAADSLWRDILRDFDHMPVTFHIA